LLIDSHPRALRVAASAAPTSATNAHVPQVHPGQLDAAAAEEWVAGSARPLRGSGSWPPAAAGLAVSPACCDHLPRERTNTYTAPASEFVNGALTIVVEPETNTVAPNNPRAAAGLAVSPACCDHLPRERTNTYTVPVSEFLADALTTSVEPETATASPNNSPAAAGLAVSPACCDHLPRERTNTYAAPVTEFL
jgi:hypothetical protein